MRGILRNAWTRDAFLESSTIPQNHSQRPDHAGGNVFAVRAPCYADKHLPLFLQSSCDLQLVRIPDFRNRSTASDRKPLAIF